ncbi:MAG: prolyl oligopeptidase family serine peptidase [Caldilineaceae bacterium]|nr:prolyl oligopeptidase family serine peptidase [Caldilineaceae bacterium]
MRRLICAASRLALTFCICFGFVITLSKDTGAATPQQAIPDGTMGIASNGLGCLAAGPTSGDATGDDTTSDVPNVGTVDLRWNGEAEQARLILTVSGAEAGHTIKLNGHAVAVSPLFAEGQFCAEGEVFYLDVPPHIVVQGSNTIELTSDALANDRWSASSIRLEVQGRLTPAGAPLAPDVAQTAVTTAAPTTFGFASSYDGSAQEARLQVPSGYDGSTPQPLILVVHPRSSDMFYGENQGFHTAADSRGWFYASPQLHGAWPGGSVPVPNPPGQYAYASLQSQYDVLDTLKYVFDNYNIDPNRIYLYGSSMGSHVGEVTVGKFASLFAAAFFNKGPSDWTQWHQQTVSIIQQGYLQTYQKQWMERECYLLINGTPTPRTPAQNPFCYQQRSGLNYARNLLHVPIAMTHSVDDVLVPVSHSRNLLSAVNSYSPDHAAGLAEDTVVGPTCDDQRSGEPGPYHHCLLNDPNAVLDYLGQFTRNSRPTTLKAAFSQSQVFYWLKVGSVGSNQWAYIDANADLANQTVNASISAATPLVLSFNLGTTPMTEIIPHPGVGLPAATYLVKEEGVAGQIVDYTTGYLDVPLSSTGDFALTISALEVNVSTNPSTRPAGQPVVSSITVLVRDKLQQPAPDGTQVLLTTSAGRFPNNGTSHTVATANGEATVALTLAANDGAAQIVAQVGNATGTAAVTLNGAPTATATPIITSTPAPTPTPASTPAPTAAPTATPAANSTITLATNPPGLQVTLDGQAVTAPHAVQAGEGQQRTLGVVSPQTIGGVTYVWVSWSDGGAAIHNITVPTDDQTYTALYSAIVEDDLIFADSFEAGNLNAWSSRSVDGGDLAASPAAALVGSYGLNAQIDDNNPLYVDDNRPNGERRYRARFYFDPNAMAMAQANSLEIFRGYAGTWPAVFEIQLRFYNGRYQVRAGILNDGTTWRHSVWFALSDAPHSLELDWQAATAPGANDGSLTFWLNDVQRSQLTGIDNDTRQVDRVRWGAIGGVDSGTRGTYFFDAFESRRATYIGPAAGGPTVEAAAADPAEMYAYTEEEMDAEDMQPLPEEDESEVRHLFVPWTQR